MVVPKYLEKWTGRVEEVVIGATKAEGGTRSKVVKVGGHTTLPFLFEDGEMPNRPVVAMQVTDFIPPDFPEPLRNVFREVLNDPAAWARECEEKYGADLICFNLAGAHPDNKDTPPDKVAEQVLAVKKATTLPLIIWGTGAFEKDNALFPVISQVLKGERCLIGNAEQNNYKTLTVTCIADGHGVIALSPLDINICKQLNILLSDMELPLNRIVIYPTTGPLGYGIEYAYSIMERTRLAALGGDKMMSMPVLALCAQEVWKTKEAKTTEQDMPQWGAHEDRGVAWEAATATACLTAGADIVVMYHPKAVELVKEYINVMMRK